jgi:Ca2+-binding EF-hand superfamily protein
MKYVGPAGALTIGLVLCVVASSQEPASSTRRRLAPQEVQDLVFLSETRPLLVRLHIQIDGKPFSLAWDRYMEDLFDYLDRDGDGILSKEEGERAPAAANFQTFSAMVPRAEFRELDTEPVDGTVTVEKLAAYYRRMGVGPLALVTRTAQAVSSSALTDALFQHFDKNKDGKLSKEELCAAPKILARLDVDDDEMVSPEELLPSLSLPRLAGRSKPTGFVSSTIFFPDGGEASARLAAELLARYDRDKNDKLSRAEIEIANNAFEQLDSNHDGELDAAELAKYFQLPPDFEIALHFRANPAGVWSVKALHGLGANENQHRVLLETVHGFVITLRDAQIDVRGGPEDTQPQFQAERFCQVVRGQFQIADSNERGYVERSWALRELDLLQQIFPLADRDGDGKLTKKELEAYLELQLRATEARTVLNISEYGRGLFEILDANRDGFLGQRELRTAWACLARWDRNGDAKIAREEIPLQFQLTISRVQGRLGQSSGSSFTSSLRGSPTRGPLWFRKMDRNGDGDVSPREFLGTPEDFRRLDLDGDGLIDAQEAEKAAGWFRKK